MFRTPARYVSFVALPLRDRATSNASTDRTIPATPVPPQTRSRCRHRLWFLAILLVLSGCEFNRQPQQTLSEQSKQDSNTQFVSTEPSTVFPGSQNIPGFQNQTEVFKIPTEQSIQQSAASEIFLGSHRIQYLRNVMETLPSEASDKQRLLLHYALGQAESLLGNEQIAIDHLEKAYAILPRVRGSLTRTQIERIIYRLGLAYMRQGETQNCCQRNTAESCILPIRGAAIHTKQKGSQAAIRYFTELLEMTAGTHRRAQWLLNIAYMTIDGYPQDVPEKYLISPEKFASRKPFPRFENIARKSGINTHNLAGSVVIDDFDGDNYPDILISCWDPREHIRFFKNFGDGSFIDQTIDAELTNIRGGINMVQADYDNDGDLDVYILRGSWLGSPGRHSNTLLQNDGSGKFHDVTMSSGLGSIHYPAHSAGWADYDNDGNVDLYVGNENLHDGKQFDSNPVPSQLFRNNGDGTFTDVATEAGVTNWRFAKGVTWGDYDGDRFPDLYISNYGSPNRLYHNNGDGTFTDVADELNVDRPVKSFPTWFWDFDNDGRLDLYVSSYDLRRGSLDPVVRDILDQPTTMAPSRLYKGVEGNGFEEISTKQGITKLALAMGANYGDLDNDGYLDFYLGTGYPDYEALMPNVMFHNRKGQHFDDITFSGGFGHLQKGHGIAFADLDLDGDQEVIAQMGGFFESDKYSDIIFENPGFGNHWLKIKLTGTKSNRSAIGARIHVIITENGKRRSIYKYVNSGGSFGANPLSQSLGLGQASEINRLEVYWPTTGMTQTFTSVPMDQTIQVTEGQAHFKVIEVIERPQFTPISSTSP